MIGPLFENLWIPFLTPKRYKNQSIAFTSSPSQVEFPIRIIRVRLFQTFSTNRGSIILPNNRNNRVDYFGRFLGSFLIVFYSKFADFASTYNYLTNWNSTCVILIIEYNIFSVNLINISSNQRKNNCTRNWIN